jgi:hypothetical protein
VDGTTWKVTFRRRFPFLQNWFSMILNLIIPCRSGPVLDSFRLFRVIQTVSHIFDCYGFLLECRGLWMEPREKWPSGADFLFYRIDFRWFWSLLCPVEVALFKTVLDCFVWFRKFCTYSSAMAFCLSVKARGWNHVKSDLQTQISFFTELMFDDFEA